MDETFRSRKNFAIKKNKNSEILIERDHGNEREGIVQSWQYEYTEVWVIWSRI